MGGRDMRRKRKESDGWPMLKKRLCMRVHGAKGFMKGKSAGKTHKVTLNDRTVGATGLALVQSTPTKYRETGGIKDYDKPPVVSAKVKLSQGGSNWYAPGGVSYIASSATQYNGTLYRRDWNAEDGYYYTAVSGPFYRYYSRSRLSFANESDNGVTLYDSTTITSSASITNDGGTPITVLAQAGSTVSQNLAFDIDE